MIYFRGMKYLSIIFLAAFLSTGCKEFNPCFNVTCHNGGYCANGQCNCPAGYSGSDCREVIPPKRIRVTKVSVNKFPATKANGAGWDMTSAADIYIEILKDNRVIWKSGTTNNANPNQVYTVDLSNTSTYIESPEREHVIRITDFDKFTDSDFMGGIRFIPYGQSLYQAFPSTKTVRSDKGLDFTLEYEYSW